MAHPVDLVRTSAPQSSLARLFRHVAAPLAMAPLIMCGGHALAGLPVATASATYDLHAAAWDTSEPRRVCQDFFCNTFTLVPPERDDDDRTGALAVTFIPSIVNPDAERQSDSALATVGGVSGNASAKLAIGSPSVDFGVAASAGKSSVFSSEARAELRTAYRVLVELRTRDLLGGLTAGACANGCTLAMDFLHQTTGRFAYSFIPGSGARASFAEVLRVDGLVRSSGEAFIAADPAAGNLPSPGATGDWTAADFLPPQSGAGGTEWSFNHFAQITDQRALFFPADQLDENGNLVFSGQYLITVEQQAEAGFGVFEYIVGSATMSADFDDTSSLTPGRLYDPAGVFDLSGASVQVTFASAQPVPEPGTWAMFAAGLVWTGWRLRERATRNAPSRRAVALAPTRVRRTPVHQ